MTSDAYSTTGIDTDIEYLLLVKFDGDRKSLDYKKLFDFYFLITPCIKKQLFMTRG